MFRSFQKLIRASGDRSEIAPLLVAVGIGASMGAAMIVHTFNSPEVVVSPNRKSSIFSQNIEDNNKYTFHRLRRWLNDHFAWLRSSPRQHSHSVPLDLSVRESGGGGVTMLTEEKSKSEKK